MKRPAVLVVTRRTIRKHKYIDYVAEAHLSLLVRLETLPVMVPVVEGATECLPQYMSAMRGLLLVEGEDIEPKHFKATPANFEHLEKTHPLKDEIEIELIRQALRRNLPDPGNLPRIATPERRLRRHAVSATCKKKRIRR